MRDRRDKGWFWLENELVDNEDLKPMQRLLYMVLARHSNNETSESFPSLETLCKKTGVKDKRTITKHIKSLEEIGIIEIKRVKGKSNRYFLNNIVHTKNVGTKNVPSTKNDTTLGTKNVGTLGTKNVPLTILKKKTKEKDLLIKENDNKSNNNTYNFQLEMILKQHNLNLQASKLLQLAKGDYDLVVKYINAFKDKGEGYLFSAIKDKYKLPVEEVKKIKPKKELTIKEKDWRGTWF